MMHYYQHHIGDFIKATARLTDSQAMTYLRMIWAYYDSEQPFANDIDEIAFLVGADRDMVTLIVKHFFEIDGDVIRHRRCDDEIAGYRAKSEGGKKGAAKRWGNKDIDSIPMANPLPEQCDLNANHKPLTDNHKPDNSLAALPVESGAKRTPKRASQLADDFTPNGNGFDYALSRGLDLPAELQSFKNWHSAKGSTMKDWQAAWRTWCDKAVEFGRAANSQPRKTQHQINQEAIARSLGLIRDERRVIDATDPIKRLG